VTVSDALFTYAFLGLPAGLLLGLGLGLVARNGADGWGGYASFRRRAARLGHVSVVMLPLIAGFYALALQHWLPPGEPTPLLAWWAAWLWIGGGSLLPVTLFLAAWRPRLQLTLPVPATALTAGAAAFALAHWIG